MPTDKEAPQSAALEKMSHVAMFAPEITYQRNVPQEVREIIDPIIGDFEWLIPSWCHVLLFKFSTSDDQEKGSQLSAACQAHTDVAYRRASIEIFPAFLVETAESRRRLIRHEVGHILLAPFHDFAIDEMDLWYQGEERKIQRAAMDHRLRHAMEQTVCDLAAALLKRGL
jgi:hypothetical protein